MGFRLLYPQEDCETCKSAEALYQDLNLDQIIGKICEGWGEEVFALYRELPRNPETEAFRRETFAELKQKGMLPDLLEFLGKMKERNTCRENGGQVENPLQKQVWFIREAACYTEAVEELCKKLAGEALSSKGLKGLLEFLESCISKEQYLIFRDSTRKLEKELTDFRVCLTYEKDRFTVTEGKGKEEYGEFLRECFPDNVQTLKSPFLADGELSDLESEILRVFQRNHKAFFEKAEQFRKQYPDYASNEVLSLTKEIAFYASFLRFQERMTQRGFAFCTPAPSRDRMEATGVYDLALAISALEDEREIVCNDVRLEQGEGFFVLTGPNQGGKTTFARSLGQMVFFSKMGLDVPARSARLPHYNGLLTHFSVEESTDSGRGKLMDELERLKPMMESGWKGAFVVINELFTTAANYDACIMGKRVLDAFLNNDCKGIYVTHIHELAAANDKVVSLRAMVDDNNRPSFEIARSVKDEADAPAGANRQVEKYHLTYQQIKERFSWM